MIEKFQASTAPKLCSMQGQGSVFQFRISMHVHALLASPYMSVPYPLFADQSHRSVIRDKEPHYPNVLHAVESVGWQEEPDGFHVQCLGSVLVDLNRLTFVAPIIHVPEQLVAGLA